MAMKSPVTSSNEPCYADAAVGAAQVGTHCAAQVLILRFAQRDRLASARVAESCWGERGEAKQLSQSRVNYEDGYARR